MENLALKQLQQRYRQETAVLQLQQRHNALAEELAQAKWNKRTCQEALTAYEHSALRQLLDKLSGKQAETLEKLRSDLRKAEAALTSLRREKESLRREEAASKAALEQLPSVEELLQRDPSLTAQATKLDALFCARQLIPLLEENEQALTQARAWLRGEYNGQTMSHQERQEKFSAPDWTGEECRVLLQRMKKALDTLEIPFQISSYYTAPTAFIASVAAPHGRVGRANEALHQAAAMKNKVAKLIAALEE